MTTKAKVRSILQEVLEYCETRYHPKAIMSFFSHHTARLQFINEANIVLLPKIKTASQITDYRPISLINNVVKIVTKILANRLAPHMNSLVSNAQNAFIKKRCIHDNFIYAQKIIQLLYKNKRSALFIKLDISKAFDSIGWSFLLEVIGLGFSTKWRDWISSLLGTTKSKVLVNGQPTQEITHARGLRQGDPLSPLLFILAIDPLLLKKAFLGQSYRRRQTSDAPSTPMMRPSLQTH